MTTKEIKTLLFNIFNLKFKYNNVLNRYEWYIAKNLNNAIFIYPDHDHNPISELYFSVYTTEWNYTNVINILKNSSKYGFVSWENQDGYIIEFTLYNDLKNIDI